MSDDISVGSVSVDIVPDTKGFAQELKTKLAGISVEIGISVNTAELRAQLEEVTRDRTATINVNADTTAAEAQIDAAARTRDAKVNVDSKGVSEASRGISGIAVAIIALGPALVPVVAAVAALGAGLTLPLAAAGGGLTVFGLLAGKAIGNTNKVAKQIDELKKRAATLVDPKARAAAAAQARALEASLTGPQRAFLAAKTSLSKAFEGLLGGKNGRALFAPIVSGMQLLGRIMPALSPVILAVSGAITGLLDSLGKAASGGGFKSFVAGFASLAGGTITTAANVIASFSKGMFNLLVDFLPLSKSFGTGLTSMGAKFEAFSKKTSTNAGIQKFVGYLQTAGPQVLSVLGSMVEAIVHIGVALAPIGTLVLGSIKVLSDAISAIPTVLLGSFFSSLIAGVITLKAVTLATKAWSVAQAILNGELTLNPIGIVVVALAALAAGLIYAYKNSETFRLIVNAAFLALKAIAGVVLAWLVSAIKTTINFVRDHWKLIVGFLGGPIIAATMLVVSNFGKIKSAGANVIAFVKSIPGKLASLAGKFASAGGSLIRAFIGGLAKTGGAATDFASKIWSAVKSVINAGIDRLNGLLEFTIDPPGPGPKITINPPNIGHLAKGTDDWRGGLTLVGERGPELVNLPAHAQVIPNDKIGAVGSGKEITNVTNIYPQKGQSEQEIGSQSANQLMFMLAGA